MTPENEDDVQNHLQAVITHAAATNLEAKTLIWEREGAAMCHPVIAQSKGPIWSSIQKLVK